MNGSSGDAGFRTTGGLGRGPAGPKSGGPSSGAGRSGGLPGLTSHRPKQEIVTVEAEPGLVVEDATGSFCGAVIRADVREVVLEDAAGRRRLFPMKPASFLYEGRLATLTPPRPRRSPEQQRSASGSVRGDDRRAKVARAHRIWVEGVHDAALLERIWGDDLRVEGVVVEPLRRHRRLVEAAREFGPGPRAPGRRARRPPGGRLQGVAHRMACVATSGASPHVLVTGHPYVDVWQAVKPAALGIARVADDPARDEWKNGMCAALGVGDPREMWRRVLARCRQLRRRRGAAAARGRGTDRLRHGRDTAIAAHWARVIHADRGRSRELAARRRRGPGCRVASSCS